MSRNTKIIQSSIAIFLAIGGLLVGINVPFANAVVSTNYQVVSQRPTGSAYADQAKLESSHSVSGDGRYVVFASGASDLVSGDTNGVQDIFIRDTYSSTISRVSISSSGVQGNAYSSASSISYDGRFVVFLSYSDTLTPGITGTSKPHAYIHDLVQNTTTLVDASSTGSVNNGMSGEPKVSADGRFVVFSAKSTNLVSGVSSSNINQIYLKDMHSGAIKILSVNATGVKGDRDSLIPDISCDGNIVAFVTKSTVLGVPSARTGSDDLIIVHLGWEHDELSNLTNYTQYGVMSGLNNGPQVSCDGNIVLFSSQSNNVVSPSTPDGYINAYQYDRLTENMTQVSLGNGNSQSNAPASGRNISASMSGDGRFVAFATQATNVDTSYPSGGATGNLSSIYIRDVRESTSELVDILPSGNRSGWVAGSPLSLDGDGSTIVFTNRTASALDGYRSLIDGFTTGNSTSPLDVYKTETGH